MLQATHGSSYTLDIRGYFPRHVNVILNLRTTCERECRRRPTRAIFSLARRISGELEHWVFSSGLAGIYA